jgi:superfamily I DNA/RNA helicase
VDGIAAAIASDISSGRFVPGDILVLVHRESIASLLKHRLDELTIPAHMFYHQESLKTLGAQEALALLQEIAAPDPISLRVLLGIGERAGRAEGYQKLRRLAIESGKSERELLEQARRGVKLGIVIPAINNRFRQSMARVEALTRMELPDVVDDLFPEVVAELRSLRQIALEGLAESESPEDLLDFTVTRVSQYDVPANPDFVRIMSLHKSKGLTSPAVYIRGAVYGVIPTVFGASDDEELAKTMNEQRRLLYVAITRSSEQLVLSSCRKVPLAFARLEGIPTADGSTRTVNGIHFASTVTCPYLVELGRSAPRSVRGPAWLEHHAALE